MEREASCLCGACRVRVQGEAVLVTACCCHDCQTVSGAPMAWNAFFPAAAVVTSGETLAYRHHFASGRSEEMHRCRICGCKMWFRQPDGMPDTIGVPAGPFRDPAFPPPGKVYFTCRKPDWLALPGAIPAADTW